MSISQIQQRPALLDLRATADFLGVPLAAIRRWHLRGTAPTGFPTPVHYGQRVAYRRVEVETWALGNTVPQSAAPAAPSSTEPAKRGRGRPRKQPLPIEKTGA